jgi:hypothetical protein
MNIAVKRGKPFLLIPVYIVGQIIARLLNSLEKRLKEWIVDTPMNPCRGL